MHRIRGHKLGIVVIALAVLIAACGGDDDEDVSTTDRSSTTTSTSSTASSTSSTTGAAGSEAPNPPTPTALPGTPTEFGPPAGGTVAVAGVAFDDVLNVRSGPGTSNPVVATLGPTATARATGNNRQLSDNSFWYEVETGGVTGWAGAPFLLGSGSTDDITSRVISQLGTRPSAPNMLALGRTVADSQASNDVQSKIVVVVAPTTGDLGEVTYDVIGLADDSIGGLRLHVFGQPESGGFKLKSVEATSLCSRGFGTPGELCP